MDWSMIIGLVATAALAYVAVRVPKLLTRAVRVVTELAEALQAIAHAMADNQLSADEIKNIRKEFVDVLKAVKGDSDD